ncbi:MAG: hypothetical protein ACE5G8_11395, partial [Anaerolineae bacterium]
GWDGGNVKLSVNGGAWTLLPPAAFQFNSYPTFLNSSGLGNDNPLAGEPAFTGTDGGSFTGSWGRSQLSLSGYAAPGDTVRLRFEMGLDGCNGVVGWYVDQVDLYYCQIDNPTTIRGAVSDAVTGWPLYSRVNVTPFGGATEAHFADPVTGQYSVTVAANVTHTLLISSVIGGYNTASRSVVPPPISSTQNFTLTANSTLCVAPGYNPAGTTALYAEDFEADDGGYIADPVGEWEWGAPGYTGVITTAHSGSNVWGTDLNADATDAIGNHTLTATLSIPAAGASLKWWDWFGDEAADERQLFVNGVEVYNDNGGTDQRVWAEHTVDVSTWAGQTVDVVFNLSVCCGEPGPDGWYIDDVSLEVTTCTPQPGGLLAGNVYDQNTGQALNGVAVKTQDAYTATTAATSFDPAVDDGFYYHFSPAGTKTVTATLQRYGPAVDSVTVALSDTVRHNFNLLAGTVLAAPRALSVTLSPGMSATLPLSLTNGGGYPARFDLFEEDSGFTPLKTQNRVAAGQRVLFDATHGGNAATYDELMADLTAAGFAIDIAATGPISAAGLAAHDIYWIPDSTTIAWSAAELSAVQNWVGGGGSVFINYDCCDNATAPVVAALFDITFTGSGGSGGVTTDIAPHPTTQGVSAVNLPSPFQSLAVGGSAVGLVNDVGGDLQAAANRAGGGKAVVVADDAFNDNGNYASSDNTLFAANIFNWLAIPSNVPWLFQDPISATLAPAASGQFSITFDAGVPEATQPGDYAATLIVQNDTPYGEAQIPVTMTVTPPGAWGKLAGTVTGLGYCDANPAPLDAAIFIQGSTGATWTLTAGTDGAYLLWLPEANRPLTATVAYSGYLTQTVAGIQITGAQTTTLDVDLRLNAPCAGAAPADFAASQRAGVVSTQTLLISNTGAASLSWQLTEAPAPKAVSIGPAMPPAPAKNRGNVERRSAPPRKQNAGVPGAPPAAGLNPVVDGGFEAGPNGGTWNEFSTNFGTPICDVFTCGFGNGTGPRSGLYWAWFGGFGGGLEDGSVDQDI